MPLLFLFSMGISKIRILTGCCDNTIHLWNINGTHRLKVPGHCGPIKGVKWIEIKELCPTFASVSDDETVMLWKLDISTETVECIQIGRGHERIINFVSINKNAKKWGASNNLLNKDRKNRNDLVDMSEKLNVALTRAKHSLFICGQLRYLSSNEVFKESISTLGNTLVK